MGYTSNRGLSRLSRNWNKHWRRRVCNSERSVESVAGREGGSSRQLTWVYLRVGPEFAQRIVSFVQAAAWLRSRPCLSIAKWG